MKSDLTNKDIDERYLSKTTDNFMIEHNIYTEISRYYKKSFISMYEVTLYILDIKSYYNIILELSLKLRKYIQYNNLIMYDVLKEIIKEEQDLSISTYNKYRCILKPNEHIYIINKILNNFMESDNTDNVLDMNKRNNIHTEILKIYLKDFKDSDKDYFKVLRWL